MNTKFLKEKVAVVTGGSRGIGRAIVEMLADAGCAVAFNYHKSQDKAEALVEDIRSAGGQCEASGVDVTDFVAVKGWIDGVQNKFGRLDILINNAGILNDKALMLMTPEEWQDVLNTNLNGMFNATRSCVVTFMKQKRGDIINISSVSGIFGLARQTNYSTSKGGMNAFTKSLAKEVAQFNIRVNAIAPGFIETDMLAGMKPEMRQSILQDIPLGRIGSPQDIAYCAKFLLSEDARYITGQVIQVDGGLVMR